MSTNTQNNAPVSVGPVVTLNGAQLLQALDFIAPDRDTDPTQLEGDVSISYGTGHAGSGYYCCLTYYPEEGAIMLDAEIADDLISSDTDQALTQQTLDDVKAGIPARDAEIDSLRKEIETLQAAQPQRLIFPTMLRKMWSGSEVQAWLDDELAKLTKSSSQQAQQPVSDADSTQEHGLSLVNAKNLAAFPAVDAALATFFNEGTSDNAAALVLAVMTTQAQLSGNTGQLDHLPDATKMVEPSRDTAGFMLAKDRAKRIYIAGPMTGIEDLNSPAFNTAAQSLIEDGWHVENPADHGVVQGAEWADYLAYDLTRLGTCSAIYLLPGWHASKGATLEVHIAQALDMEIFTTKGAIEPSGNSGDLGTHNLNTSAGGRGYVAEYFSKRVRRHDFTRYINERLAADFACALAQHLSQQDAPDSAMERALTELVEKIIPGLDTGDLLVDAATASKALDRAQPSGNPGNLPELTIQWHDTPEAVHRIFWEKTAIENGLTYEELIEGAMVGETEERQKVDLTYEQEIQAIRDQKCWGCADTDTNQIHVWAAPDVDHALLIHMLAHEIGHLTGEPHPDDIQEELRAETFGKVAALAYHMLPSSQDTNKVHADPLQDAADWLVKDCGVKYIAELARRLSIGYNRASRLMEAARKEKA